MAVEIKSVKKFSALYFKGVRAGDKLVAVNGNKIRDFLDYEFYIKEEKLVLDIEHNGKIRQVKLSKKPDDGLGLEF